MADMGIIEHSRKALQNSAWGAFYGFAAGSLAGYISTALKVAKAVSFINLGIAVAAGVAAFKLLTYIANQADFIQKSALTTAIVNSIAIPTISLLTAIAALPYATLTVYTIAVVAAGTWTAAHWLSNSSLQTA
jgi:hypothetical protein